MTQIKKTIKHSAIYAIGTMLRRLTGLVMLPIYTRYLTPTDYGAVELLTLAIELMGILVGLRISSAVFRYYILAEGEDEKHEVVSTILMVVIAMTGFGVLVLYLNAGWMTKVLFGNSGYILEFKLFTYTLMTNAIISVCLSYIRAKQLPILFVSIGVFILCLQVLLNIIFVVQMELHVLGVVYSTLMSSIVVALGLSVYVFGNVGFRFSRALLHRLIKFIAPLILAAFGGFYVAYADKYFIRIFNGVDDVGLYALAARVSSILLALFEAFNTSWAADRFEVYKKDDARRIYDQMFRGVGAVLIIAATGLALFSGDLFRVMTQPAFYSAAYIVPLLAVAALVRSAVIFCSFGVTLSERTRHSAEASWLKAVVATVGYLILIPYFGVYGAAFTLAVASLVQLYWVHTKSSYYYDMELNWKPVTIMLILSFVSVVVGLLMPQGDILYFVIRVFVYCALIASFYFLPLWSDEEKKLILSTLSKIVHFGRFSKVIKGKE